MDEVRESGVPTGTIDRTWVEISKSRIAQNLELIRQLLPSHTCVIAVMKANAYGHGVGLVAPVLKACGVERFAVADAREGIELRRLVGNAEILVTGGCDPGWESAFIEHDLTAAWFDTRPLPPSMKVHVKIETGMGRLGIPPAQLKNVLRNLRNPVTGIFSTLSSADNDPDQTRRQIASFHEVTEGLGIPRHLANSAGLLYEGAHFEAVRPGLALYGVPPNSHRKFEGLKPLLRWRARVLTVNAVEAGVGVGYSGTFRTTGPSRIGIIGVGYADGFSRAWSNSGQVSTREGAAPVVGRVSMDLLAVDLTSCPNVRPGDPVTLLENNLDSPLSASALARGLHTIPYEILTLIGPRVQRVLVA